MKIFKPLGSEPSEFCHPVAEEDFFTVTELIDGTPRAETWKPMRMHLIREDERGRRLRESDSPWFGSRALIFRPQAVEALETMLRAHGEILPLDCEEEVYLYNVTRVLDALDETASDIHRLEDGSIFRIKRHEFKREMVENVDIFKITTLRVSPTFVSHRFADTWKSANLRGLEFIKLWSSEEGGVPLPLFPGVE